ncbi:4929_t:CDS:2, partial [Dentiscutata erythropus]
NKFEVTFNCGTTNITLCNKVQNQFEEIGTIITSVLILNSPITVNASFVDFCTALGECDSGSQYITLGGAIPARTIQLQDDDGRIREYPQALVKQFQFDKHPEYSQFDILAMFNSKDTDFWFTGDPQIKSYQQDFLLVALHEIIHGLGFVSNWDDYINYRPEALTPVISTKFNRFLESAFDKYMIYIPTGERISTIITKELDKFTNKSNNQFSSFQNFASKFKASPQYKISLDMMKKAITPFSLGFLPHGYTNASDAVILETSLKPYTEGSSISHVDLTTYNSTSDFLMKFLADQKITLENKTNGNNPIGPKLKLVLETLG